MAATVMPFALERTTHVFEMTDRGGIQDVAAKEPGDTATIGLIRQHLMHVAELFCRGDFRDPMSLHSAEMTGVRALSAGSDRVRVEYQVLRSARRQVVQRPVRLYAARGHPPQPKRRTGPYRR